MFQLAEFPADTRTTFHQGGAVWPLAVQQTIAGGVKNVDDPTNLVFG